MNPGNACEPSQGAHYQKPSHPEDVSVKHPQKPHKCRVRDLQKPHFHQQEPWVAGEWVSFHCVAEAKIYTCRTHSAKVEMWRRKYLSQNNHHTLPGGHQETLGSSAVVFFEIKMSTLTKALDFRKELSLLQISSSLPRSASEAK